MAIDEGGDDPNDNNHGGNVLDAKEDAKGPVGSTNDTSQDLNWPQYWRVRANFEGTTAAAEPKARTTSK